MAKNETRETTHATQETAPWAPAIPALQDLIGKIAAQSGQAEVTAAETAALDSLAGRARAGDPWAGRIGALADDLFAGGIDRGPLVADAHAAHAAGLAPTARGDFLDPARNPALAPYLATLRDDAANQVNAAFAAAGRDLSPAHAGALARGVAAAEAPVLADLYGAERGRQLAALDNLFAGGRTTAETLGRLDQAAIGNRKDALDVANAALSATDAGANAMLAIEAKRRGLPLQNLGALADALRPLAQLGGTQVKDETSTTEKREDPTRAIIGGVLGGLSLLGGNPAALLGIGQAVTGGARRSR